MIHKNLTTNQGDPIYQKGELMRKVVMPLFLLFLFVAALPFQGYAAEPTYPISTDVQTTRERTVTSCLNTRRTSPYHRPRSNNTHPMDTVRGCWETRRRRRAAFTGRLPGGSIQLRPKRF